MPEGQTKINAQGRQDLRIGRLANQEHQALPLPPVGSCLARFHTRTPLLQRGHPLLQASDPPIQFRVAFAAVDAATNTLLQQARLAA